MAMYSVNFINNSQNQGSACLYQQSTAPSYGQPVFPLAWFVRSSFPGSQNNFQWTLEYSFVWAQTGMLMPGVTFSAAQQVSADPTGNNLITFTQQNGNFQFGQTQRGYQSGMLAIQSDMMVPPNQASVGIGMSGFVTFATQAQPNMTNVFTPNPIYWLTFGNYQQGQVLDPGNTGNAVQLNFSAGVYVLTVTLNPDNTYTVQV
jgi:hypothetical protein